MAPAPTRCELADLNSAFLDCCPIADDEPTSWRPAPSPRWPSGAFALVSTTKLLTVEEMLEALRDSGGVEYRAPGAVS
jgi:hypothetical protein